jgi:hypothetical protein
MPGLRRRGTQAEAQGRARSVHVPLSSLPRHRQGLSPPLPADEVTAPLAIGWGGFVFDLWAGWDYTGS